MLPAVFAVASASAFMAHAPHCATSQALCSAPAKAVLSGDPDADEPLDFRKEIMELKVVTEGLAMDTDALANRIDLEFHDLLSEVERLTFAISELSAKYDTLPTASIAGRDGVMTEAIRDGVITEDGVMTEAICDGVMTEAIRDGVYTDAELPNWQVRGPGTWPRCLEGTPAMAPVPCGHPRHGLVPPQGYGGRKGSPESIPTRFAPTRFLLRLLSILVSRSMSALLPTQEIQNIGDAEAVRSIAFFLPASVLMSCLFYNELTSWTALDTLLYGPR